MRYSLLLLAALLAVPSAFAQKAITTVGVTNEEDFDGFNGAGFQPTPVAGQLSSNEFAITGLSAGPLNFGGSRTLGSGDFVYTRGPTNGGVTTAGIYSYQPFGSSGAKCSVRSAHC